MSTCQVSPYVAGASFEAAASLVHTHVLPFVLQSEHRFNHGYHVDASHDLGIMAPSEQVAKAEMPTSMPLGVDTLAACLQQPCRASAMGLTACLAQLSAFSARPRAPLRP